MSIRKVNFGFGSRLKRIGKTEYKYVYEFQNEKKEAIFVASISSRKGVKNFCDSYNDVKVAAKAVDLHLIKNGKKPVNILKKK